MKHPEQIYIPGTEPVRGPCDDALTAWQDACETADEANAEKRQKRTELVDRMLEVGISRLPIVDRKTKRRKWLEITQGEPRLRAVVAEQEAEGDSADTRRGRRTTRTTETPDPFAATRELAADPAGLPENGSGLPVARADGSCAIPGRRNAPGAAGESVEGGVVQSDRLLRPGQRRRTRGVR